MRKFLRFLLFVVIITVVYFTSTYLIDQNGAYVEKAGSGDQYESVSGEHQDILDLEETIESGDILSGDENISGDNANEESFSGDDNFLEESGEILENEEESGDKVEIISGDTQFSEEMTIDTQDIGDVSGETSNIN